MSFFAGIGKFFKSVFGWVIKSDPFKQLVAQLMPTAISIVSQFASISALSNEAKRAQAIAGLKSAAQSRGLEFADHMLALLVELAVAKLKGTVGE